MTVLVFELLGRDNSATRVFREVGNESNATGKRLTSLGRDADNAARSFNPLEVVLTGVHRALVQNAAAMAKATAAAGGLTVTAVTLAPYLGRAGQEIWAVTEAAIGASPALLGMAAGAGVALGTLKLGFSGLGAALKAADTPAQLEAVNEALADLHPAAREVAAVVRAMRPGFDALRQSIQGETFKDLATDVKATGSALMTSATPGMVRFSGVVNTTIRDLLKWGGSNEGIRATEQLTNATYIGMARLSPSITRVVTSFGAMIGRIAEVSMAAGASGLGGALDWLAGRMDRVTAATVSDSLADLRNKYETVKDAVTNTGEAVATATRFYDEHRATISAVSDVLSVLAIAFGGPVVATGAAVGLIIRHWDDLKAAKASLQATMASPVAIGFLEDTRASSESIVPALQGAWQAIWDAIGPRLTEIWHKIKNELLPAFGDFVAAISPIVAIVVDVLGPVVAGVFGGIVSGISGAISVITGIFQFFAGLLTGDWSKMWEGIKNILSGAWDIIVGLFNSFLFGRLLGIAGKLPGLIGGLFGKAGTWAVNAIKDMGVWVERSLSSLIERIPGVLGNVVRLLYEAGRGIVQGLINGIVSMISAAGKAMMSVVRKVRNMLPFSPAKEGPLSGSGAPDRAGRKIPAMIAAGMLGGLPDIVAAAYRLAGAAGITLPALPPMGVAGTLPAGPGGNTPRLVLDSAGSRLDDAVMEIVKNALRTQGGGDIGKYLGTT